MKKDSGKSGVVILDRYTLKEVARYNTVKEAAADLDIKINTIYNAIILRSSVFDCYWVYEKDLPNWMPAHKFHMKVRGINVPKKLKFLIDKQND